MVRYSNAVQLRPTKMLAMTTGTFTAKLCGQTIKFMVDTGSELNLIPERLLTFPGLALDFEGSRWALKGVNGAPVGLKGCCMDVPVQIGQHDFDHHFFVSRRTCVITTLFWDSRGSNGTLRALTLTGMVR